MICNEFEIYGCYIEILKNIFKKINEDMLGVTEEDPRDRMKWRVITPKGSSQKKKKVLDGHLPCSQCSYPTI